MPNDVGATRTSADKHSGGIAELHIPRLTGGLSCDRDSVSGMCEDFEVPDEAIGCDLEPECTRGRLVAEGATPGPGAAELRERIESAFLARAPDVETVEIAGLPLPDVHELGFVPQSAIHASSVRTNHAS